MSTPSRAVAICSIILVVGIGAAANAQDDDPAATIAALQTRVAGQATLIAALTPNPNAVLSVGEQGDWVSEYFVLTKGRYRFGVQMLSGESLSVELFALDWRTSDVILQTTGQFQGVTIKDLEAGSYALVVKSNQTGVLARWLLTIERIP